MSFFRKVSEQIFSIIEPLPFLSSSQVRKEDKGNPSRKRGVNIEMLVPHGLVYNIFIGVYPKGCIRL